METTITSISYRDDHNRTNTYTVGECGVTEIVCHSSKGEGDKWYYDVIREDNTVERLFSFENVIMKRI